LRNLAATLAILCAVGLPARASGADAEAAAKAMIARYVATWDIDAFFADPAVRPELQALLGPALSTLRRNLSVTGNIEYVGASLTIRGNAPHRGTEEEAIVCVQPYGPAPRVHAAIFSEGAVTIYTRESRYSFLTECIKDWITLVNSRHVNRMTQPPNVRMMRRP
jgi:hypothetical protein